MFSSITKGIYCKENGTRHGSLNWFWCLLNNVTIWTSIFSSIQRKFKWTKGGLGLGQYGDRSHQHLKRKTLEAVLKRLKDCKKSKAQDEIDPDVKMRRNWVKWSCYAAPEFSGAFRQSPPENVASRAETRVLCPTRKLRCILEAGTGLLANSVHQREFSPTGKLRCGQKTSTRWKSRHQRGNDALENSGAGHKKKHHLRWARC